MVGDVSLGPHQPSLWALAHACASQSDLTINVNSVTGRSVGQTEPGSCMHDCTTFMIVRLAQIRSR